MNGVVASARPPSPGDVVRIRTRTYLVEDVQGSAGGHTIRGAWAQLAALLRSVFTGCDHPHLKMPARLGHLFDPDRFPFLEGRSTEEHHLPLVSDGHVYRVLDKLLMLDGERLSYRTLDVEQIGSVYETMMGFKLQVAPGQTIALKPAKAHGAPVPVNLEDVLAAKPGDRAKVIKDHTDYKLTTTMNRDVKAAESIDGLLAALERLIARSATPQPVPAGTMVLMPTDERRKTGSHYTPRSLTEPIVAKALEQILAQLGENPTPDDILSLKVCDPAMGSGAFLVEACRQLAEQLVAAWAFHGYKPSIPEDEDEDLPEDVPEQLWWPTAAEALAFAAKLPQTRRRLPWRYRWPEETRDEVLARLLELNKQRAEEERRTGQAAAAREKKKGKQTKRRRKKKTSNAPMLLDIGDEDDA